MKKTVIYLGILCLLGVSLLVFGPSSTTLRGHERRNLAADPKDVVEFCSEGVSNFKKLTPDQTDSILGSIKGWYQYFLECKSDNECEKTFRSESQGIDEYTFWALNCVYVHTKEKKNEQAEKEADKDVTGNIKQTANVAKELEKKQETATTGAASADVDPITTTVKPDETKAGVEPPKKEDPNAKKVEEKEKAEEGKAVATPDAATKNLKDIAAKDPAAGAATGAATDAAGGTATIVVPPTERKTKDEKPVIPDDLGFVPNNKPAKPTPEGAPVAKNSDEAPPAAVFTTPAGKPKTDEAKKALEEKALEATKAFVPPAEGKAPTAQLGTTTKPAAATGAAGATGGKTGELDECDKIIMGGFEKLTPEEREVGEALKKRFETIGYTVKADVETRLKIRQLIAGLIPVIKELNKGSPIALFENFLNCKAQMLFPPTAEEEAAAALAARAASGEGAEKQKAKEAAAAVEKQVQAAAAATGNVSGGNTAGTGGAATAGKCEVEFKNKFKGELLDLAADYLKCEATNCGATAGSDEACARKCLSTTSPVELIGLHNCRFKIVPIPVTIEKEGVSEIKKAEPVKPAGTPANTATTTTTTTTTTKNTATGTAAAGTGDASGGFRPPGQNEECYKLRQWITTRAENDVKEAFFEFFKCLMTNPLEKCASFTSKGAEIEKYYGCLKQALFVPTKPVTTVPLTTSNNTTATSPATGGTAPATNNNPCLQIENEILNSGNEAALNDLQNLFNCAKGCKDGDQLCFEGCKKAIKTEWVLKYFLCREGNKVSFTPPACEEIRKKFTVGSNYQVDQFAKCQQAVPVDPKTNSRDVTASEACWSAVTDSNAVAFLTCMKDNEPKAPEPAGGDGTSGGTASAWDLRFACEPIKVFSLPECKPIRDKFDEFAKNQVKNVLHMAKFCNEATPEDGCFDRLIKKFVFSAVAGEFLSCTRKFIPIPIAVPQPCQDFRRRVWSKLFEDYSRKYIENVIANCAVTATNNGQFQETCFKAQIPLGADTFLPLGEFHRCIAEFEMARDTCPAQGSTTGGTTTPIAAPCQKEQDIAAAKQPEDLKNTVLCMESCRDDACAQTCATKMTSQEVKDLFACRKNNSPSGGSTTSPAGPCDQIKASLPQTSLQLVYNFFDCNKSCPPDATGRQDQTCLDNCRKAVTDPGANKFLDCLVPPPQPCDYDFNQAAIESDASKLAVTKFRDAANTCQTKPTPEETQSCLKIVMGLYLTTTATEKVKKYFNCRANPPAAGAAEGCLTLESRARTANNLLVDSIYTQLKACNTLVPGTIDQQYCDKKQKEFIDRLLTDATTLPDIREFVKCLAGSMNQGNTCEAERAPVQAEVPVALTQFQDQLEQCKLQPDTTRDDCFFNARVFLLKASKSPAVRQFLMCRFQRPGPRCIPQYEAAVTENNAAASAFKDKLAQCFGLMKVQTDFQLCIQGLAQSVVGPTSTAGPKLRELFNCQFPPRDCSIEHAASKATVEAETDTLVNSLGGCKNIADEASRNTCFDNARNNALIGTPAPELVEFLMCIAPPPQQPPAGGSTGGTAGTPTGPCATVDTAAKTKDDAKFTAFITAMNTCEQNSDIVASRACRAQKLKETLTAATTSAELKDSAYCREQCGDLFLAAKKDEAAATVVAIHDAIDACLDPTKTDAERKTCFDAVASTNSAVAGQTLNYMTCRLPPPPPGPCDSYRAAAETEDATLLAASQTQIGTCQGKPSEAEKQTCLKTYLDTLQATQPANRQFVTCFTNCGIQFLLSNDNNATLTGQIKTAIDTCQANADPNPCYNTVRANYATAIDQQKEYIRCRLPPLPCDLQRDAANTESQTKLAAFDTSIQPCQTISTFPEKRKCFLDAKAASDPAAGPALQTFSLCITPCGQAYMIAKSNEDPVKVDEIRADADVCWGPNTLLANQPACFAAMVTKFSSIAGQTKNYFDCITPPPPSGSGGSTPPSTTDPCQAEYDGLDTDQKTVTDTWKTASAACPATDNTCKQTARDAAGGTLQVLNKYLTCTMCKTQIAALTTLTDKNAYAKFYSDVAACKTAGGDPVTCVANLQTAIINGVNGPLKDAVNCSTIPTGGATPPADPCQTEYDALSNGEKLLSDTWKTASAACADTDSGCKQAAKTAAGGTIQVINKHLSCTMCKTQLQALTDPADKTNFNKFYSDVAACVTTSGSSAGGDIPLCVANLKTPIINTGTEPLQNAVNCATV